MGLEEITAKVEEKKPKPYSYKITTTAPLAAGQSYVIHIESLKAKKAVVK